MSTLHGFCRESVEPDAVKWETHVLAVLYSEGSARISILAQTFDTTTCCALNICLSRAQVDLCSDPELVRRVAAGRPSTVCISALTGDGLDELASALELQLAKQMTHQRVLIPYGMGEVRPDGTAVKACLHAVIGTTRTAA